MTFSLITEGSQMELRNIPARLEISEGRVSVITKEGRYDNYTDTERLTCIVQPDGYIHS